MPAVAAFALPLGVGPAPPEEVPAAGEVAAAEEEPDEEEPDAEDEAADELQAARAAVSIRPTPRLMLLAARGLGFAEATGAGAGGHGMTASLEPHVGCFRQVINRSGYFDDIGDPAGTSVQIPRPRRFAMRTMEVAGTMPAATASAR